MRAKIFFLLILLLVTPVISVDIASNGTLVWGAMKLGGKLNATNYTHPSTIFGTPSATLGTFPSKTINYTKIVSSKTRNEKVERNDL